MVKSRYVSEKPAYQKTPGNRSQPPMGAKAVYEWEKFSPLTDFSDQSLAEVFKRISRDIIERPYHYDPHKLIDQNGAVLYGAEALKKHVNANNNEPPAKIPGIVVYKQNHGTGHAIRQMVYTETLLDKIAADGNAGGRDIARTVNNNPEMRSILKLAAYCKRLGRTLDIESDHDKGPGEPSIYSKRSADLFERMAKELGYNHDLIKIMQDSMLEPAPKGTHYKNIAGIDGQNLFHFSKNVMMAAHRVDLVRCKTVDVPAVESELKHYFEPSKLNGVAHDMILMGCKANQMTGNPVKPQNITFNAVNKFDGKKLVGVVNNIDKTIDDLVKIKPNRPTASKTVPLQPAAPAQSAISKSTHGPRQSKSLFAFDVDDTLAKEHSFKVNGGPLFDKNEFSKIKTQMDKALKNGHEVWIVTANWSYTREKMQKLFAPDPDNVLGRIKFYNGGDIGKELGLPKEKLHAIHSQGLKGQFLAKKIANDPQLKNYNVNCTLFDDTQAQINNCAANSTSKIKIQGYRVDDYQALRGARPTPPRSLSTEFAERVKKAAVVGNVNQPIHNNPAQNNPAPIPNVTPMAPNNPLDQKGKIIPFRVDFMKHKTVVSDLNQALKILNEVDRLHKLGAKKVGITYSANQSQTDDIIAAYKKGQWKTGVGGSNQAGVINEIEKLLTTSKYKHLQQVYRTVPITTMKYKMTLTGKQAATADAGAVEKSLENANQFMANGGVLLGWTNQITKSGKLAIGGGVAIDVQTDIQKDLINDWVKRKLYTHPAQHTTVKPDNAANPVPTAQKQAQDIPKPAPTAQKPAHPSQKHINGASKPDVVIENKYEHKTSDAKSGRRHMFEASTTSSTANFKAQYKTLKGDHLKTKILEDIKILVERTTSRNELADLKKDLMATPEYEILKTGQGLYTRITGIKTSSVVAFENMFTQRENSKDMLEQHKAMDKPAFKAR